MTNVTPSRNKQPGKQGPGTEKGSRLILEYTGLAARYLVILGLSVWAGLKVDRMLHTKFPVLVWVLPLFCIVGLVVKAIRDTSK